MFDNLRMFSFVARSTAYFPADDPLEGGFQDRHGKPLCTLQEYLGGKKPYVSVAMDLDAFPYGTKLCIPALEARYGKSIEFRVTDTGGAFVDKGTSRIDVCVENEQASFDGMINGHLGCVALVEKRDESISATA